MPTVSYWPAEPGEVRDVTVCDTIRHAAATVPDRVALVDCLVDPGTRREWTYAEFLADVERVARALLARFAPGDRIAVWAPNSAEWIILQQGVAMAGMVLVALNPAYRTRELEFVLRQSGAAGLFCVDTYRDFAMRALVDDIRPRLPELREVFSFAGWDDVLAGGDPGTALPTVAPDDIVQVQYTSGTTGFPKGAMLHHKGLVNEATFVAERAGFSDGGVYINAMPMYHIGGGAVTSFGAWAKRGTFVILPGFDPGHVLEAYRDLPRHPWPARAHDADLDARPPGPHPARPVQHADRPEWRCGRAGVAGAAHHGAARLPVQHPLRTDRDAWRDQPDPDHRRARRTGEHGRSAVPGSRSRSPIRNRWARRDRRAGRDLPPRLPEHDRLLRLPDETAATIDDDGWLHTGRLGAMDGRGTSGHGPGEGHDHSRRHEPVPSRDRGRPDRPPGVEAAAVIGVPDPVWGEQIGAVLRLRPTHEPSVGRRAHGIPAGADRAAQDSGLLGFPRRAPDDADGEDPEVPAPRGGRQGPARIRRGPAHR